MRNGGLKIGKAIALAAFVASLSLAVITPRGAEPGAQSGLARQGSKGFELPSGAVIIEEQPLESESHPDRALILWMVNPITEPSGEGPEEYYSCRSETRGSSYRGPTRVSLLNTETRTVINTIEIKQPYEDEAESEGGVDSFDIPYAIRKGYYYKVESNAPESEEVKPRIIWLKDYNGDGRALEFALFDALACMGLPTTLIGYSEWQDKVIQYQIYLEIDGDDGHLTDLSTWCDYLFSKEPKAAGYWEYEINYRGRGGPLSKYEIRYDAQNEMFKGKCVWTVAENEKR